MNYKGNYRPVRILSNLSKKNACLNKFPNKGFQYPALSSGIVTKMEKVCQ